MKTHIQSAAPAVEYLNEKIQWNKCILLSLVLFLLLNATVMAYYAVDAIVV